MLNWLNKFFGWKPNLEKKDPSDYKKTRSSTHWRHESYCRNCDSHIEHEERMTRICLSCGTYDPNLIMLTRSAREIWDGDRWVTQVKCCGGEEKILAK